MRKISDHVYSKWYPLELTENIKPNVKTIYLVLKYYISQRWKLISFYLEKWDNKFSSCFKTVSQPKSLNDQNVQDGFQGHTYVFLRSYCFIQHRPTCLNILSILNFAWLAKFSTVLKTWHYNNVVAKYIAKVSIILVIATSFQYTIRSNSLKTGSWKTKRAIWWLRFVKIHLTRQIVKDQATLGLNLRDSKGTSLKYCTGKLKIKKFML